MVYLWRYADEAGVVADGPAVSFGSQEAAESWLSESYADLLDEGISAVSCSTICRRSTARWRWPSRSPARSTGRGLRRVSLLTELLLTCGSLLAFWTAP